MRVVVRIAGADRNEDRAVHRHGASGDLLVVADGAGGIGGGGRAADLVLQLARQVETPDEACALLRTMDAAISSDDDAGESTAVLIAIRAGALVGASVGDSGAWMVSADRFADLTEHQWRKPLLGSGAAEPVGFGPVALAGRLLVASDGLLKYAPRAKIVAAALSAELLLAAEHLLESARLPSGGLQDDVAIVLAG